jgi:hypothetical protein
VELLGRATADHCTLGTVYAAIRAMAHIETYGSVSTARSVQSPAYRGKNMDASNAEPSPQSREAGVLLRSLVMWAVLYVPMLIASAATAYMAFELHAGPGRVFGAGDRGSPNAQFGDK